MRRCGQELVQEPQNQDFGQSGATIASVSQNDCYNPCQSPAAGPSMRRREALPVAVKVCQCRGADIETEFSQYHDRHPGLSVHRKPPRLTRPRPNVTSALQHRISFSRPLETSQQGLPRRPRVVVENRRPALHLDYTTDFSNYIQPHRTTVSWARISGCSSRTMSGNIRAGAYQSWGSEMAEMRAWVLAKLLWNPALTETSIREFLPAITARRPMTSQIPRVAGGGRYRSRRSSGLLFGRPRPNFFRSMHAPGWKILKKAEAGVGKKRRARRSCGASRCRLSISS